MIEKLLKMKNDEKYTHQLRLDEVASVLVKLQLETRTEAFQTKIINFNHLLFFLDGVLELWLIIWSESNTSNLEIIIKFITLSFFFS